MRRFALLLLLAVAFGATACSRAADLIPGEGGPAAPKTVTPPPVSAPPLLVPSTLRLAGAAGADPNRPVIADVELARSVVQVQALDGAGLNAKVVRGGSGVVVDKAQGLILTSYCIVAPFKADGTRAYAMIAVGAASGTGPPEYQATLVAASPEFDFAVLRLGQPREGITNPQFDPIEAVLADTSSLKRGDRLRLFAQASNDRAQAIQTTSTSIAGFRGDGAGEARAWLKLDGRVPGTVVGGPAFDQSGSLIGIASQLAYDPNAPVAQIRPLSRAIDVINAARQGGADARFTPPLAHPAVLSGAGTAAAAGDGVAISRPAFAANVLEGQGYRDLFDYTNSFPGDKGELQYEFATQGIPQGAAVQERWYLNGVQQDSLSSSYTWNSGSFAIVSDRLATPNARNIPNGAWTLEVWVAGVLRASSTAFVGVNPQDVTRKPAVETFRFASSASPEQLPGGALTGSSTQVLAFFDYRQAAAVQRVRWVVLRNGQTYYQSAAVPWAGGDHGTWWVGVPVDNARGSWEVQVYFDDIIVGTGKLQLS
ncbi:MAG: serine protease [Dehalococcoidia bacterium]|nr:serine protease [Dehalococcoidia bacterium]